MKRIYVGCISGSFEREVFISETTPTKASLGLLYSYVIGPFRTVRGANWMADPIKGTLNPHCKCVSDAERLAKLYA
jgi:hypothetical protein